MNKIICGHILPTLKAMPDNYTDTIITSPPYWGLRDYGKSTRVIWDSKLNCRHNFNKIIPRKYHKAGETNPGKESYTKDAGAWGQSSGQFCLKCGAWYGQLGLEPTLDLYINHLLQITAELKRVLKPTGVLFWNHGDYYGGSMGSTGHTAETKNLGRKTFEYGAYPSVSTQGKMRPKCMILQNYRLILRMIDEQGWILRNDIKWHKKNPMPSSVKDRFNNVYEPVFMLVKNKKYWFDLDAVRVKFESNPRDMARMEKYGRFLDPVKIGYNSKYKDFKRPMSGTLTKIPKEQAKSFGSPRARYHKTNEHRKQGMHTFYGHSKRGQQFDNPSGKNPGDLWTIPTQSFPEAHFATFPEKLIEPMLKSSCPEWICKKCGKARVRITKPDKKYAKLLGKGYHDHSHDKSEGMSQEKVMPRVTANYQTIGWTDCGCNSGFDAGIVLDPFMGAGTVAVAAKELGRKWLGIEINPNYIKIANKRILNTQGRLL